MVAASPTFGELEEADAIVLIRAALDKAKMAIPGLSHFVPWKEDYPSSWAKMRKTSAAATVTSGILSPCRSVCGPIALPPTNAGMTSMTATSGASPRDGKASLAEINLHVAGRNASNGSGTAIEAVMNRLRELAAATTKKAVSRQYALDELDGILAELAHGPERRMFPMKYVLRKIDETIFDLYKAGQCDPWEHCIYRLIRETQEFSV